jgi:hypothetical protein
MYEKNNDLDASLNDIMVVLTMDPHHIKARVRRSRVYEIQGKIRESLIDLAIVMLVERARGIMPTTVEKIEDLVKALTRKESPAIVEKIRSDPNKDLPSRSYCLNFLETFPNIHQWKKLYANTDRCNTI